MKKLKDILYKAGIMEVIGSTDIEVSSIAFDSRKVERNGLFIAVKGTQNDGHKFISQTISSGAIAIVSEEFPKEKNKSVVYIKVSDSESALGIIASNFYENPSEKLKLVGVTGTNGKTTTATLLHNLFLALGYNAWLISTVVYKIGKEDFPATHTTPDSIQLNKLMKQMVDAGCRYCFMEIGRASCRER